MKQKETLFKIILPVGVLLIAAGIVAVLIAAKPKPVSKPLEEKVWQVSAVEIKLGEHAAVVPLLGRIISPSHVTLSAAIEADVKEVNAENGQYVEVGEELVVLDNREAKQRFQQRQAEYEEWLALIASEQSRHENDLAAFEHEETLLELSAKTVERLRRLAQQDLGARAQLDEAMQSEARQKLAIQNRRYQIDEHDARIAQLQAKRKQANARLELAKLELERTRLVSPVTGRITSKHVAVGQRVRNGDALVSLFDKAQLEVIAQVPWNRFNQISAYLKQGMALSANLFLADRKITASLERVESEVEPGKGGVNVVFTLTDLVIDIPLGQLVDLELLLPKQENVVVLPYEALYGLDKVYRIVEDRLVATNVQVLGESVSRAGTGRYVVIQSEELVDEDQVLITKFANAMEGLRVRIAK